MLLSSQSTALSKRLTSVGSAAAALPPFGLIEPFGLRQGSCTALSKRLTGSFFRSATAPLPPFGHIEPFGLRQGSRTALSKRLTLGRVH
jgi:hypothetical protein